jgi:hypothetical protein
MINLALSQAYNPLIRENVYWDVNHGSGQHICFLSGGDRYFFQGDTTFNSTQYKILRSHPLYQINSGPYCPPFGVNYSFSTIRAFMREDTTNRQVFIYGMLSSNSEALLFDYTLNVGDTLFSLGSDFPIDSTGFITLNNGESRKIWYVNSAASNDPYFIEGITGSEGIMKNFTIGLGYWEIPMCFTENNFPLWGNECSVILNTQIIENPSRIILYPNPAINEITVEIEKESQNQNYKIEIIDFSGKVLISRNFELNFQNLNIENLNQGVYLCRIIGEKEILNEKFIVNK